MRRLPSSALAALAAAAALAAGLPLERELRARTESLGDHEAVVGLLPLARALPGLLAIALAGRLVLALLPAGRPGSHAPRRLAATWAAAHLLGSIALALQLALVEAFALPDTPAAWLAPWVALALLRLATLPGAPVPGAEPPSAGTGSLARISLFGLLPLALLPVLVLATTPLAQLGQLGRGGPGAELAPLVALADRLAPGERARLAMPAASWLALLCLLAHGFRLADRTPARRRALILLLALTPAAVFAVARAEPALQLALCLAGGAVCLVTWVRRADPRALAIAAAAFAACPLASPRGLRTGAAGLAVLVLATPRPGRVRALLWSGGAALLVALPAQAFLTLPLEWHGLEPLPAAPSAALEALWADARTPALWGLGWPLVAAAVLWWCTARLLPATAGAGGREADDAPAIRAPIVLLLACLALEVALSPGLSPTGLDLPDPSAAGRALLVLAPLAALAAGLVLVPAGTTREES